MALKPQPAKVTSSVVAAGNCVFASLSFGRVLQGSRSASANSVESPGQDSGKIFPYFATRSARILSKFARFRRGVAGMHHWSAALMATEKPLSRSILTYFYFHHYSSSSLQVEMVVKDAVVTDTF